MEVSDKDVNVQNKYLQNLRRSMNTFEVIYSPSTLIV